MPKQTHKLIKIDPETDVLILKCGDLMIERLGDSVNLRIPRHVIVDNAVKMYIEHLRDVVPTQSESQQRAA